MRILYDSKLSQFKTPFGTLQENETCTFHILIPCSCRTTAAALVLQAENGQELRRVPLAKQSDDTLYDTWGGEMAVREAGLYTTSISPRRTARSASLSRGRATRTWRQAVSGS